MSNGDPCFWGLPAAAGGVYFFYKGMKQYALKKEIECTPTSKAIAVAPGIAEVSGIARPFNKKFVSPLGKKECLYYATELYKWSGSGKHRHKDFVNRWESEDPIYIEDETGMVLVKPTVKPCSSKSKELMKDDLHEKKTLGRNIILSAFLGDKENDPDDSMYSFVSRYAPGLSDYSDSLEVYEHFIEDGDPLYVLGTAKVFDPNEREPRMIVCDDRERGFFCISDGSEKDALSNISLFAMLTVLGGPILTLLGCLILVARFGLYSTPFFLLSFLIPLGMYLWLLFTWLVSLYNGLISLKNGVDRAHANIDALLAKRRDLIPQLVEIVKGYARYEKSTLEEIAGMRSDTAAGKNLIALAEKYPELRANESFGNLQKELAEIETHIAGLRGYYNDAVMFYNKQIAVFPYLIVAGAMRLKPVEYYSLGD